MSLKNFLRSMRVFYYRNLTPTTIYHGVRCGVKNLILWFPVIWRDRQWDHFFFFSLLAYKFFLMEKYFKDFGISVSSKKDARRIRICKNLCQRLRDDCYTNPYEERNKPYHEWFRNSILRGRKVDKTTGLVKTVFDRENEPDDKWILSASEHEEYLADQDLELLGKLMKKHSRGWWD